MKKKIAFVMFGLYLVALFMNCDCFLSESNVFNVTEVVVEPITQDIIPRYWDWRDKRKVSPVKNQGSCDACWAFSVIANIESHLSIYRNKNVVLSEQFLLDCDGRGVGCNSDGILDAFSTIVNRLGGVLAQRDYRKYSGKIMKCHWNGSPPVIPVIGYRRVKSNEDEMAKYLYNYGPLSAGINPASMKIYKGGIDEPSINLCPPNDMRHAVLIVGYNVYVSPSDGKQVPYWIIKNSWGVEWGDKGFYYLVRGRNACGIANDVSFSFV